MEGWGTAELARTPGANLTFAQTGRAGAVLGLSFKIFVLSIATLTLYRFWGRTEVRRYLWGHSFIHGEPLDYLGKGSELFIGFLLAFVIYLLPLGIGLQLAFLVWAPETMEGGLVLLVFEVAFFFLIAAGLYQALRYRLSRTAWRGIRFALKGSAFAFGRKFIGLGVLNLLTAGWLTPVTDIALFRIIARNATFGDKPFRFEGQARALYPPFALSYLLLVLGLGSLAFALSRFAPAFPQEVAPSPENVAKLLPYLVGFALIASLLSVLAGVIYAASRLRVMGSGLRYEGLRLKLDARTLSYLRLVLGNALILLFTFGIALPVTELRRFRYIFQRLSAEGVVDLDTIGPSTGPQPRFGEGLAEAFGLGNV